MEPIEIYDLIEDNRDWEVVILPYNQGVIIGNFDTISNLLNRLERDED